MRAYGQLKASSHKIHPHDKCGICSGTIIPNGSKRMKLKQNLKKEMRNYFNDSS